MNNFETGQITKEIIFEAFADLCNQIFIQERPIEASSFFKINSQIDQLLSQFDDQTIFAKELIKNAVHYAQQYLTNQVNFAIRQITIFLESITQDPKFAIPSFLTFLTKYQQKSIPMTKILYYCVNLLEDNPKEFVKNLLDNIFISKISGLEEKLFTCLIKDFEQVTQFSIEQYFIDQSPQILEQIKLFYEKIDNLQINIQNCKVQTRLKEDIYNFFKERCNKNLKEWIQNSSIQDYLVKVKCELKIIQSLLEPIDKQLYQSVTKFISTDLLFNYKEFLSSYLMQYADNELFKPIQQLLDDSNFGPDNLYDRFKQLVLSEGRQIITECNLEFFQNKGNLQSTDVIKKFYDLYRKYKVAIKTWLSDSDDFSSELNNAFDVFLQSAIGNRQLTDYLLTYIDDQISDREDFSELFIFINSNQIFISAYKSYLGKRLIKYLLNYPDQARRTQLNAETRAVEALSQQYKGNKVINSLFAMIDDAKRETIERDNYSLILLTDYHWPKICKREIYMQLPFKRPVIEKQNKMIIINDIISLVEVFWHEKQITLTMSVAQAIILYLFQFENASISIADIVEVTELQRGFVTQNCKLMSESQILIENIVDDVVFYELNENLNTDLKVPVLLDLDCLDDLEDNDSELSEIEKRFASQDSDFSKVELSIDSKEFQEIYRQFRQSDRGIVHSISKIYNKFLWETYLTEKNKLIEERLKLGTPLNSQEKCRYVWHGVQRQHPSVIYQGDNQGFDPTLSRRCAWGKGIYFAKRAKEARKYAFIDCAGTPDKLNMKKVFLCCIITTGKPKVLKPNMNIQGPGEGFDCVQGNRDIFVLYGNSTRRAYPAYEIIFT